MTWVTQQIFSEWHSKHFCHSVLQFYNQYSLPQKAVLLLDSAPGHPSNLEDDTTNGYVWGLPERVLEDYNILKLLII